MQYYGNDKVYLAKYDVVPNVGENMKNFSILNDSGEKWVEKNFSSPVNSVNHVGDCIYAITTTDGSLYITQIVKLLETMISVR